MASISAFQAEDVVSITITCSRTPIGIASLREGYTAKEKVT